IYPLTSVADQINACDLAVICNVNFARPMLDVARKAGKWIATDVHAVADLDDPYNQDYMRTAQILFISSDSLSDTPEETANQALDRFGNEVVVIGLGSEGALLAMKHGIMEFFPSIYTRPVINTIGAGDALFSCFVHEFCKDQNPLRALRYATVFASFKIGEVGAAEGFLNEEDLEQWVRKSVQKY
ncbi:MAG: carbohydrate kinase family protein, partial [Anaerolineaceae bacterium]|nr:carbohydrate kinase family protein [Anaerolineaceae bacterium]